MANYLNYYDLPLLELPFKEIQLPDNWVCIDYLYQNENTFPTKIHQELRGIIFDKSTGDVVRRPLHKFWNAHERPSSVPEATDTIVLEKLDGSMVTPLPNGRWATRKGTTEVAMRAEQFVAANPIYHKRAMYFVGHHYTPIFEWCDPDNPIVIPHKAPSLTLLTVRNNTTGEYLPHNELFDYDLPVVNQVPLPSLDATDTEGVVLFSHSLQDFVKIKTKWYLERHRAWSNPTTDKIVELILNGGLDDIPDNPWKEFEDQFWKKVSNLADKVFYIRHTWFEGRKEFAIATTSMDPTLRSLVFSIWDGGSAKDEIVSRLRRNPKLTEPMLGVSL